LLLSELAGVRAAVERYAHINEVTLGRKGSGRSENIDSHMMIDRRHIQESLHRLENVNTANLHELLAARNDVRRTLRLLGTERLDEVLAGVVESIPALAADLGKHAPTILIDDGGHAIHKQASGLIENVFMHLIRNAVDHGLEKPAERLASGKSGSGAISVKLAAISDTIQLTLKDDGRGLALDVIRKVANEKGLNETGGPLSDLAAAHMIFRPGFSTAEKVTDVSGRGVGMDAVVEFVTREGGKIDITFDDEAIGAPFRQFHIVVSLPGKLAVAIDAVDDPLVHVMPHAVRPADDGECLDGSGSLVA
jgi:two-component system chemotaxis sensor kinase CheA